MPSSRTLEAGKAIIRLSLQDNVSQGLSKVALKMKSFGNGLQSIGKIGLATSTAIAAPFIAAVKHASDAQESLSRFKQVFGEQEKAASKFAAKLAKSVGRSAVEIKDGLSSFQSFFIGLGFSADKSRELSQQLQALSIDFASFNNLTDEESLGRFLAAMSGSSEVFDKYGINTKEVALEQEILAMGIKKSWSAVSEQEKAMARLNIITKSMGAQGAVGDAARTADSFANRLKALSAQAKDAAINIGTALLPAATKLVATGADAAGRAAEWAKGNEKLIVTTVETTAKVWLASAAITAIGKVVNSAAMLIGGLKVAITAATANPVIAGVTALAAAFKGLDMWVDRTYRHTERLGKKLKEINYRPLTEAEQAGGPYMTDLYGNPILDMPVAEYYGDNDPAEQNRKKRGFSNGRSTGTEKGAFSNGQTIGGPNDPWDNPRSVPFANTPTITPEQRAAAAIGTGYDRSKGSKRKSIFDRFRNAAAGLGDWVEDGIDDAKGMPARLKAQASSKVKSGMKQLEDFLKGLDKTDGATAVATLDARNSVQQFGRQSKTEALLGEIRDNTKRVADQKPGMRAGRA